MKRKPLPLIRDCRDCGACCEGQAALPIHLVGERFTMESVNPLPPELAQELRETTARFLADGFPPDGSPCIWYDAEAKRCKHYDYRPTVCRDEVKPGDEACRRMSWDLLATAPSVKSVRCPLDCRIFRHGYYPFNHLMSLTIRPFLIR